MKGLHKLTASGLALLLAASFVVSSWSAPQAHFQRRNWTPQAMLYLKGAQGRRFIPEESQRKDLYDRMHVETRSQSTNPFSLSEAAALFLSSLQKAKEDLDIVDDHQDAINNCLAITATLSPLNYLKYTSFLECNEGVKHLPEFTQLEEENSDHPGYLADSLSNW